MQDPLHVTVLWHGTQAVVRLRGELDLSTAGVLSRELRRVEGLAEEVVVDAGQLEFLDLAGVDALLEARDRLAGGGVPLRVAARSRPVCRLLQLLGEPLEVSS